MDIVRRVTIGRPVQHGKKSKALASHVENDQRTPSNVSQTRYSNEPRAMNASSWQRGDLSPSGKGGHLLGVQNSNRQLDLSPHRSPMKLSESHQPLAEFSRRVLVNRINLQILKGI